jgi:hypothetical protein
MESMVSFYIYVYSSVMVRQHIIAMFLRDCLCEVVLPLWSHLHGSYMMVLLLLLLGGTCVCVQTACLQPGIQEEGGHRGCR